MKTRKVLLYISSIVLIMFLGYIIFIKNHKIENSELDRPEGIPSTSFYLGGVDGGVWVDSFRTGSFELSLHIYSEIGELIDTCYIVARNEKELNLKIQSLAGHNGLDLVFY